MTPERIQKLEAFITVPTGFQAATESLPLIVMLHGAGERGKPEKVRQMGVCRLFSEDPDYRGLRVITLSPVCPVGICWHHIPFDVMELIQRTADAYHADPSRISLTGLSMGGYGTWEMGTVFPDYFSALGPICGGGIPALAKGIGHTPVWAFHGEEDTVVPLRCSEEMVEAVNRAGGTARLTVYPGVGHKAWIPAYEQSDLISWLVSQKKGESPSAPS